MFVNIDQFHILIWILWAVAALTFILLLFVTAPYGRHRKEGWGLTIPSRTGWILMESVPTLFFTMMFIFGSNKEPIVILFWAMWTAHYVNRGWAWPIRAKLGSKQIPVAIVSMGVIFNVINAWINGEWLFDLKPEKYGLSWLYSPQFIIGFAIFITGMVINIRADDRLFRLREDGSTGYKIPAGGMYRYISCPNYFGEMLEWIGWAIATWSLAGLTFAIWTIANLFPRSLAHHKWYKKEFEEYPKERKAIIPFII